MKIGEFSKKVNLPVETIYYYINSGILYPFKNGYQYKFTDKDIDDVKKIKHYQSMGFSIREIIEILSIWHWSNNIEESVKFEYLKKLKQKRIEIKTEIDKYKIAENLILEELESTCDDKKSYLKNKKIGIPIEFLGKIICPDCGENFNINNASMNMDYIFDANLECDCGRRMEIKDGILYTGNYYSGNYDKPDIDRNLYLGLSGEFYKALNTAGKIISGNLDYDLSDKVIMETNINGYSFIYNNLLNIRGNPLIILIDKFPEIMESYKKVFSKIMEKPRILFIADDSLNYPLRKNSIDIVISLFSFNEHALFKKEPYFKHISDYLKDDGKILGSAMTYKRNSKSVYNLKLKYPEAGDNIYVDNIFKSEISKYFKNLELKKITKTNAKINKMSFSVLDPEEYMTIYSFAGQNKQ